MQKWQYEVLAGLHEASDEHQAFSHMVKACEALEFEYCSYVWRLPYPLALPKTLMLSNYPSAWRLRYAREQYALIDPTIKLGLRTDQPQVWDSKAPTSLFEFWEEVAGAGIRAGWAKSHLRSAENAGMLTLARSDTRLGANELQARQEEMEWLCGVCNVWLPALFHKRYRREQAPCLTERELEVLRWAADGKSAGDIAQVLAISKNTVDFHIKNAVSKLGTANRTAAVARAAMLGLLAPSA